MKTFILNIGKFILSRFYKKKEAVKFKHGVNFRNNGHIDTLNPQFIEIGDNFVSAPGAIITAHDASTFFFTKKYRVEKVKIGNNVFLGANSVVLPGVTIGDNVIIGAGSIVSKNIPSNSVYIGNPATYYCSVTEYIKKCNFNNVLYDLPDDFAKKLETGEILSQNLIEEFQMSSLNDYNIRVKNG